MSGLQQSGAPMRLMTASVGTEPSSPGKGEVDREAGGRGSRFSRTKSMTARARNLRADMTMAESRLWRALRRGQLNGFHFRRQHPIGPYTVDFYCPSLRLGVEVDGGQHAQLRREADRRRTKWLEQRGIVVVRYWNNDVLANLPGVLADLIGQIEDRIRALGGARAPALPLSRGRRKAARP